MKDYWKPVFVSVLVYLAILFLFFFIIPYALLSSELAYSWYTAILLGISTIISVVPGLIAGYMFKGSGIRVGAVVGFLSVSIVSLSPNLAWIYPAAFGHVLFLEVIVATILNAISGGCGELIRKKNYL